MEIFKKIDRGIYVFTNALGIVAGIMMALLTGFVFAEVLCRYVFKSPIVVTTEMTNILFPWIVSLSAISIAKDNGNTALVFIKEKFRGTFRHVAEIAVHMVMLYFSVFMAVASFNLSSSLSKEIMVLTGISKALVYGSMFVGFVGITIVVGFNLFKYIIFDMAKMGGERE
ncbi:MAG: TRAP transporter small permease [Lachnospiraceae bacterium]|nr:TRAP transporter small permease [Lachnospiraceae bacterium]